MIMIRPLPYFKTRMCYSDLLCNSHFKLTYYNIQICFFIRFLQINYGMNMIWHNNIFIQANFRMKLRNFQKEFLRNLSFPV